MTEDDVRRIVREELARVVRALEALPRSHHLVGEQGPELFVPFAGLPDELQNRTVGT